MVQQIVYEALRVCIDTHTHTYIHILCVLLYIKLSNVGKIIKLLYVKLSKIMCIIVCKIMCVAYLTYLSDQSVQVTQDLTQHLTYPLAEAPLGSAYSPSMCRVERVAALCAIAIPGLALPCAKLMSRTGDHCGAASIVLIAGAQPDPVMISFALQVLLCVCV